MKRYIEVIEHTPAGGIWDIHSYPGSGLYLVPDGQLILVDAAKTPSCPVTCTVSKEFAKLMVREGSPNGGVAADPVDPVTIMQLMSDEIMRHRKDERDATSTAISKARRLAEIEAAHFSDAETLLKQG
jgi:hypothetical protein